MKIYLAGPIFTYGDLLRNTEWAAKIRAAIPGVDLYSPVKTLISMESKGKRNSRVLKKLLMEIILD